MPGRHEQTPLRRLVEQAIMWVILAGTVALAATVNTQLNRLGEDQTIGGVTLRLPRGWQPTDEDGQGKIELREHGEGHDVRTITVRQEALSLSELFAGRRVRLREETVALQDGSTAQIRVLRRELARDPRYGIIYELEVAGIVPTPAGKNLLITLTQVSVDVQSDTGPNVMLMKKILDTVRFE